MQKNITLKLDAGIIKRIKHIAIDNEKSVSLWVADLIRETLHSLDDYDANSKAAIADLQKPLKLGGKICTREELYDR